MKASTFLFTTDLVDEGFDTVLDRLQSAHLDGLSIACNYHHSRDVFPHNPVHRVRYMQGGVFFRPESAKYKKLRLQPDVPMWVQNDDPLQKACQAADRRGLVVRAWTNNTHSSIQASAHPDCAIQNAFGDRYINSLCPARADTRRPPVTGVHRRADPRRTGDHGLCGGDAVPCRGHPRGGSHRRQALRRRT